MSVDMNPRTCIVTREEKSPAELIRFVLDPKDQVTPDIKRKLPGRGVWVSADRKMIDEAISKGHFQRGFKRRVMVDNNLTGLVEELLRHSVLGILSLAKKSGNVVTGQSKSNEAVRAGVAGIVIHAENAAVDGTRKLQSAIRSLNENEGDEIPKVFDCLTNDELDNALGTVNIMHLAILSGGIADKLEEDLIKLTGFRNT